jgi:hypothetical protein
MRRPKAKSIVIVQMASKEEMDIGISAFDCIVLMFISIKKDLQITY